MGIEPTCVGFANRCLTTWLPHRTLSEPGGISSAGVPVNRRFRRLVGSARLLVSFTPRLPTGANRLTAGGRWRFATPHWCEHSLTNPCLHRVHRRSGRWPGGCSSAVLWTGRGGDETRRRLLRDARGQQMVRAGDRSDGFLLSNSRSGIGGSGRVRCSRCPRARSCARDRRLRRRRFLRSSFADRARQV